MKGNANVLILTIFGILIAILLIFSTTAYSEGLLKILTGEKTNNINSEGMFANLVHQIDILGEGDSISLLYGFGKDYMVAGFPKKEAMIKAGVCKSGAGLNAVGIKKDIYKPITGECDNKGCLCLCQVNVGENELCNKPGTYLCSGYGFDIKDDLNDCGLFVMQDGRLREVYLKREKDSLYANIVKGGKATLSENNIN